MPDLLPALSLVAVPGRRRLTLEVAREAERRGFGGLYVPSIFGNMAQSTALAFATERIVFGTAIAPIYARTVEDFAHSAAYVHEASGGLLRGNQDARGASIWMRKCRRMRDGGRA
jgi:alkanesulfonate monooxygenase SsuD/methylene tetrahydromethanopterin reductase-like flavin-dependent oxidoreductase (luciferase family)